MDWMIHLFGFALVVSHLECLYNDFPLPNMLFHSRNPSYLAFKPNLDVLYSSSQLELSSGMSLNLTLPDTSVDGRTGLYYLTSVQDANKNVLLNCPGWRTTGKDSLLVLIAGPNAVASETDAFSLATKHHDDEDYEDYDVILKSPTSLNYMLIRTNILDPNNLTLTRNQQDGYILERNLPNNDKICGLSSDSLSVSAAAAVAQSLKGKSYNDAKTVIFELTPEEYYELMMELMILNPPNETIDEEILQQMADDFGMIPGHPFSWSSLSPQQQNDLSLAKLEGEDIILSYEEPVRNGWTVPNSKTSQYGNDYVTRASFAYHYFSLVHNDDSVYYSSGILSGSKRLHLNPVPPCNAFWSITVYDEFGHLIPNDINRYFISSQSPFLIYLDDGGVSITFSEIEPIDSNITTNWVPVSEEFDLMIRVYWPDQEVLDQTWFPPALTSIPSIFY